MGAIDRTGAVWATTGERSEGGGAGWAWIAYRDGRGPSLTRQHQGLTLPASVCENRGDTQAVNGGRL